ncbi:F-box protein PP2-B13-like [Solanum dulcamara]|uniref:F-box protein PP2-B13-like n=1 Tax=Solanum dulcamara TaxID=45834 RepID=UPI0024859D58|nr:F-box protein PP2-B13-like [Solanum dulcamara]
MTTVKALIATALKRGWDTFQLDVNNVLLRFCEAAYLMSVGRLDIRGRIGTEMLSPKTEYSAYLVFNLLKWSHGLESAKSSIKFVNYESEIDTENQYNTVHFARAQVNGDIPKMRGDRWMEVELG